MFLIAMATLVFEITLSRLLSVITWYHLGFFAISVAMLGMTAGAIRVFLRPDLFDQHTLLRSCALHCYLFSLSVLLALLVVCFVPVPGELSGADGWRSAFLLAGITVAIAAPFYFSGVTISALLSRSDLSVNRIYAADLAGAASGCLLALWALSSMDTPSVALLAGVLGVAAGHLLLPDAQMRPRWLFISAACAALLLVGNLTSGLISPAYIKSKQAPRAIVFDDWNSYSRVMMGEEFDGPPSLWGGDREKMKSMRSRQHYLNIDGVAGTSMRYFKTPEDVEHLKWDVTNVAYHLRPQGGAAIVGVGGGRDVQAAVLFGHQRVLGIELNPIFVDLLKGPYRDFVGVADHPAVELVVDDARSYFANHPERFAVLQMSLIDTWATTGAGAFSLSENGLYTIEAWRLLLSRLAGGGLLTVSRWYDAENASETGRALSLAVASLLHSGVDKPSQHLAMVSHGKVATLLLSLQPLSQQDISNLDAAVQQYGHQLLLAPGKEPTDLLLQKMVAAESMADLLSINEQSALNLSPPTDQSPYFFNMLKLAGVWEVLSGGVTNAGVVKGNINATVTLVFLIALLTVLTVLGVLLPLLMLYRREAGSSGASLAAILFFCFIGAGFMTVEIALLQRLSVFLGHPTYALGILLFSIIASTGLGSFVSDRLFFQRRDVLMGLSLLTAISVLLLQELVSYLMLNYSGERVMVRIFLSVAAIFPLGILLGCFFPAGMRQARALYPSAAPWFWGLNGIFGVLFSSLAVFISIYVSISTNFYLGALFYSLTAFCFYRIYGEPTQ